MNRNKIKKIILSIIFLLTSPSCCFALSSDSKLPFHFKSDQLIYNNRQSARFYAQARKITYHPITKIVLLEHHSKVTHQKNVFTGPHIWYDIATGIVRTSPKKNHKTMIVIQPQDK